MKIVSIGEILFDCFPDKKVMGGAPFNFIYHIKKLTNNCEFISRIGYDENGRSIIKFLEKNNITSNYIQIDNEHSTGIVNVEVDNQGIPTFNIVANCAYDFIEPTSEVKELIESNTSLLYFGTLAQRNYISRNTIQSLLQKKIKYFYDINLRGNYYSAEILFKSLEKINVLKLNENELKIISELILLAPFEIDASAKALLEKLDLDMLSVTLGENGALLMDRNSSNLNKYLPNQIIDTVGAGDAYAAILCLGYLKKLPIEKINLLANKFAVSICEITGAIPQNDEIYHQLKEELSE